MPIYRGAGGSGTVEDIALASQIAQDSLDAEAAATAAAASETAAASSASAASSSASSAAVSASSAAISAASAEAALDAIEGTYLGAQASDPSVDLNGDPLTAGDWYFNTTDDQTRVYTGSAWVLGSVDSASYAQVVNNLSDLADAATARTNLGLGTAATTASTDYATAAQGTLADSALQSADIANMLETTDIGVTVQAYDATIVVDADIANMLETTDIGVTVQAYDATIVVDADIGSTVQAYDADTAKTDVAQSFTAAQRGSTQTNATTTGSVTLDFATYQNFVLTMTGNVTLANPSTEAVGQSGFIVFIQDATGGRTVSLGTDYETANGTGLTLSSAASTTDVVPYIVVASGRILLGAPQKAFS